MAGIFAGTMLWASQVESETVEGLVIGALLYVSAYSLYALTKEVLSSRNPPRDELLEAIRQGKETVVEKLWRENGWNEAPPFIPCVY